MFIDVDLGQILESKKGFALTDGDKIQIFSILDMRQNTHLHAIRLLFRLGLSALHLF